MAETLFTVSNISLALSVLCLIIAGVLWFKLEIMSIMSNSDNPLLQKLIPGNLKNKPSQKKAKIKSREIRADNYFYENLSNIDPMETMTYDGESVDNTVTYDYVEEDGQNEETEAMDMSFVTETIQEKENSHMIMIDDIILIHTDEKI